MDYNLLKIFIKVAELGSFTQAAKALNQPKSRVSRGIARLESQLGASLIQRTTRKTSLTLIGQELHQNIAPLVGSLQQELTRVSQYQQDMAGVIRVTASEDIGQLVVSPLISTFVAKYPDVQFETVITNEFLDLTDSKIDIAFRAGRLKDSSLKQRKILDAGFILVCSPDYVEKFGCPATVEDLTHHRFLSFRRKEKTFFKGCGPITPVIISDSITMLLNLALKGGGITALPDFFCKAHLAEKSLTRIIPSWSSKAEGIHIVFPPAKSQSKKVRAFIDLAASF